MLRNIIKSKLYLSGLINNQNICGRDICMCVMMNTDKYEDYLFYDGCYNTWVNFNRGLNLDSKVKSIRYNGKK